MGRRAERTYFNTEYMPELEENAITGNDPLEMDRLCRGGIDDVIDADKERFRRLCKQHGFDFSKASREYERKKKAADALRAKLPYLQRQLHRAQRCGYNRKELMLMQEIGRIEAEIRKLLPTKF